MHICSFFDRLSQVSVVISVTYLPPFGFFNDQILTDSFEQLPELSEKGKDFIATPVSLVRLSIFFSVMLFGGSERP